MKKLFIILMILLIAVLAFFTVLGFKSQTGAALGIINNQLQACPETPNCITSDIKTDDAHFATAIAMQEHSTEQALQNLSRILILSGGEIQTSADNYLAATFRSSIFQFIDDVEIRVDPVQQKIHFRSASRVGKSDFGANLKRINLIKARYNKS